jgi:hypothetical protein
MSVQVTLDFEIIEARGLPRPSPNAHQIPSCALEIPGLPPVETPGVKDSVNPAWNQHFAFKSISLSTADLLFSLTVSARSRQKARVIARVNYTQSLSDAASGTQFDHWVPLESEGQSCGELHFGLRIVEIVRPEEEETRERAAGSPERSVRNSTRSASPRESPPRPSTRTLQLCSREEDKTRRAKLQILNDEGDLASFENTARANAERHYVSWSQQSRAMRQLFANAREAEAYQSSLQGEGQSSEFEVRQKRK